MSIRDESGRRDASASGRGTGVEIYERLKHDILSFEFQPNERLVELALCDRYEVSRTPVREALQRVEDDGLVVSREKGGRVVRGLDITDYEDVCTVRRVLEVHTSQSWPGARTGSTFTDCSTTGTTAIRPRPPRWTGPTSYPTSGSI